MNINKFFKNSISSLSFQSARNIYQDFYDNSPDYKTNPAEHEKDKILGREIEETRANIIKIKNELKSSQDAFLKKQLEADLIELQAKKESFVSELTTRHLKFALKSAHVYKFLSKDFDGLVSSAYVGILKAAEKFAPSKYPDIPFLTYARHWVNQQIMRDFRSEQTPSEKKALQKKIKLATAELSVKLNRKPTQEELANALGISERKLRETEINAKIQIISLDAKMKDDPDSSNFADVIPDANSNEMFEELAKNDDMSQVQKAMEMYLTPRERYILEARYRLNQNSKDSSLVVYGELAQKMNLTGERVRQIEQTALAKLRRVLVHNSTNVPVLMPQKSVEKIIPEEKKLEENLDYDIFVKKLTDGETQDIKEKLINKLNSFDIDEFEKIVKNTTSEKNAQYVYLRFFKKTGMTFTQATKHLNLSKQAIISREKVALADIKRFLLEDGNQGYSFFQEALCNDSPDTHTLLSKRVRKTSQDEMKLIMENTLLPKELEILNEKFSLNSSNKYGCKVKSHSQLATHFNISVDVIDVHVFKGMKRLKKYFSKTALANTNLSNFATVVTEKIKDEAVRKTAFQQIQKFDKTQLDKFFGKILTEREWLILTKRYNLEELNAPKQSILPQKMILEYLDNINDRRSIGNIEERAIDKIRTFFEDGIVSNRVIFADKLLKQMQNNDEKIKIKNRICEMSEQEFNEVLDSVLVPNDVEIIKARFNLHEKDKVVHKLAGRTSYFSQLSNTLSGLRHREASAMKKLYQYFTVGLPSNIDVFATEIAQFAKNDADKQKILDAFKGKNIEQLQKELKAVLTQIDYQVVCGYYALENYIPILKENPNIIEFAKKINKNEGTVHSIKRRAITKLAEVYSKGIGSNLNCFVNAICDKVKNQELKEQLKNVMQKTSREEFKNLLTELLPEKDVEILTKRFCLNEDIPIFNRPVPMEKIALDINMPSGTISYHEICAFKKIIEYFEKLNS